MAKTMERVIRKGAEMAEDTVESLQAEVIGLRAQLTEVHGESKGHRLSASNARKEAETLKTALESQIAELSGKLTQAERTAADKIAEHERLTGEKVTAAEAKAIEAATKAAARVVTADLRLAAKDAGAKDMADVLALLDRAKLKTNGDGDVTNAAELVTELKAAKPYLFGGQSTSSTATPPAQTGNEPKRATDMTDAELKSFERTLGLRV